MTPEKNVRRTNADLWFYTLSALNVAVFLVSMLSVVLRSKSSDVKVPIRLVAGNGFVQGNWWNTYLLLAIVLGFLVMAFVYSSRLKKIDPIYRNGALVFGLCFQIFAAAVLFRVAGLSGLI